MALRLANQAFPQAHIGLINLRTGGAVTPRVFPFSEDAIAKATKETTVLTPAEQRAVTIVGWLPDRTPLTARQGCFALPSPRGFQTAG